MNKQKLIKRIEDLPYTEGPIADTIEINRNWILKSIEQLDEPEMGHADEAPRYVKNILARLRELPLHNREVWLNAIMGEFEKDFSSAKWREGYEQGKFEGMLERDKVTIPQFVAEYIEESRLKGWDLLASMCFVLNAKNKKTTKWFYLGENKNIFALAWIYGYEVEEEPEKEKRYWVKLKAVDQYLVSAKDEKFLGFLQSKLKSKFTRKELEEVGFGWVIDCPGIELEEVE